MNTEISSIKENSIDSQKYEEVKQHLNRVIDDNKKLSDRIGGLQKEVDDNNVRRNELFEIEKFFKSDLSKNFKLFKRGIQRNEISLIRENEDLLDYFLSHGLMIKNNKGSYDFTAKGNRFYEYYVDKKLKSNNLKPLDQSKP